MLGQLIGDADARLGDGPAVAKIGMFGEHLFGSLSEHDFGPLGLLPEQGGEADERVTERVDLSFEADQPFGVCHGG